MPVEIDDIKLEKIHKISTLENAGFVYQKVVGRDCHAVQNFGMNSVRLKIEGICYGEKAKDELEKIRNIYTKREPVDFIADIVSKTYVSRVIVDNINVSESAAEPMQFSYVIIVAEYSEQLQKADTSAVDRQINADASALMNIANFPVDLSLNAIPEITDPFESLNSAMEPVKEGADGLMESMEGLSKLLGV